VRIAILKILLLTIFSSFTLHSALAESADQRELLASCFDTEKNLLKESLNFSKRTNFGLSTKIESNLSLSIINETQAQALFQVLTNKRYIPFDYVEMGCEARAHEMARIMDDMCLRSGKAFLMGDIRYRSIGWLHHVAPILLVEKDGITQPYIFDPSVFDKAVPLSLWSERLKRGKILGRYKLALTSQFVFMPSEIDANLTDYRIRDIVKTKAGLALFSLYEGVRSIPETTIKLLKKVIK